MKHYYNFWFGNEDFCVLESARVWRAIRAIFGAENIDWADEVIAQFAADHEDGGGTGFDPSWFPYWFARNHEWWRFRSVVENYLRRPSCERPPLSREVGEILVQFPYHYMRYRNVHPREAAHYEAELRSWVRVDEREFLGLECLAQCLRDCEALYFYADPSAHQLTVREKIKLMSWLIDARDRRGTRELGRYLALRAADRMGVWEHTLDELRAAYQEVSCTSWVWELIEEFYPAKVKVNEKETLTAGTKSQIAEAAEKYFQDIGRIPSDWDDGALKVIKHEGNQFLIGVLEWWDKYVPQTKIREWEPSFELDATCTVANKSRVFVLGVKVL